MEGMTSQEVNERLAKWAGFRYHGYQVYEYEHKETRIEDPYWSNPKGYKCKNYPNFTQSLDACFKWLVPKLNHTWDLDNASRGFRFNIAGLFIGVAETPALAFCLAIEKLIIKEGKDGR